MAKQEESTGETAEPNTLKDRWGNEHPYDPERYPEGSAAREGKITKPSGQGGATPKARPDHQDMFPPNPEPSAHAKEYGERLSRQEQGEEVDLQAPLTAVDERKTKKGETTTTSPTTTTTKETK